MWQKRGNSLETPFSEAKTLPYPAKKGPNLPFRSSEGASEGLGKRQASAGDREAGPDGGPLEGAEAAAEAQGAGVDLEEAHDAGGRGAVARGGARGQASRAALRALLAISFELGSSQKHTKIVEDR